MEQTIQQQVINAIRILPEEKQKEILEYVKKISEVEESGENQQEEKPKPRKLFQKLEELRAKLPPDAWKDSPTDGSLNHDHYLYGAPKRKQ